ncbi:MAG: 2Fe-2S iron-sulfur cluster binding domain-containing protein [Actinophytocola sp.]|nr:2Fe-2S iron-sulfur cluster binding domain-containing protein [Actinophytocola sp.]
MTTAYSAAAPAADDPAAVRQLLIQQATWEADDVISLRLVDPSGAALPAWTPGAHLDVILPSGLVRQYSLCGEQEDRSTYTIAVLREPAGRGGSSELHQSARPGTKLAVRGPRNHFELEPAASFLFIAGGIGITPVLPMARRVSRDGAPWQLLYGGRSSTSMAFLRELEALGDHITIRPEDRHGLLDLDTALRDTEPGTHVYCCGPPALIAAVEDRCRDLLPESALHVERFAPAEPSTGGDQQEARGEQSFEVELRRTGRTVTVPPGMTIVDAVRDVVPDVMTSCEEGFCGTCETKVLEGVPEHHDTILNAAERANGKTMMICVGRACSSRLVLDL